MEIAQLIEIALANSDQRRVEVAALEPAEIGMEAVSGLSQMVAELVDNALAFSGPQDVVRVTGLHEQADYLISISDRGVGIPEQLLTELNRLLEDPDGAPTEPRPGMSLIARLAARHSIDVRLVPGAPGTTARVTIPGRMVGESAEKLVRRDAGRLPPREEVFAPADEPTVDLTRFDSSQRSGSGVIAMSEDARRRAELFLESVFGPVRDNPGVADRPPSRSPSNGNSHEVPSRSSPQGIEDMTTLRVRVPGANFTLVEDDPSTAAAERAIDIRSALARYQEGRRSAEQPKDH